MVGEENSQKVWSLFTCVILFSAVLSGCGGIQLSKVYPVGFLNDNQGYNRQGMIQSQRSELVALTLICEEYMVNYEH